MKSFIVNTIAAENPYESSVFVYSDAGAWRHGVLPEWPNKDVTLLIGKQLKNKILFAQITNSENIQLSESFPSVDLIEGGFFMGSQKAVNEFEENFWAVHDVRFDQGLFVGKDQHIMNWLAFKEKPTQIARLKTWLHQCEHSVDVWFFYQNFLASDHIYKCWKPRQNLIVF